MSEKALLSLAEAAARLGLLQSTLRDAVRRGYLHPVPGPSPDLWFRVEDVDRLGRRLGRP